MAATSSSIITYLFYCKTVEGHCIKTLSELLQNNIKDGSFTISKRGIFFNMTDSARKGLYDAELYADNFSQFKFRSSQPLHIGLTLSHLFKILRGIKKKDSLSLFIEEGRDTELGITVHSKEKNRTTTSYIKIQNIQSLSTDPPTDYSSHISVMSNEYTKIIKDLSSVGGNQITIASNSNVIRFKSDGNGLYNRDITFGDMDDDDSKAPMHTQEFEIEQLVRTQKISGLSTQIQIYQAPNLPIYLKSLVGTLGKISIYIKDRYQVQSDNE